MFLFGSYMPERFWGRETCAQDVKTGPTRVRGKGAGRLFNFHEKRNCFLPVFR